MNESELKPKFEDEFPQDSGMTQDEEKRYETGQISAAEARLHSTELADMFRGEPEENQLPDYSPSNTSGYSGRNAYQSKTNTGKHPISIKSSPRVMTSGDANSGDPHLR